eukprot:GEZU01009260.1.p1 GENE.GEZU01009260.1~~GEZU01009260.1.p1  ORF type:complete len:242 (+),score=32.69 GEZU01009260.1:47-772(+)
MSPTTTTTTDIRHKNYSTSAQNTKPQEAAQSNSIANTNGGHLSTESGGDEDGDDDDDDCGGTCGNRCNFCIRASERKVETSASTGQLSQLVGSHPNPNPQLDGNNNSSNNKNAAGYGTISSSGTREAPSPNNRSNSSGCRDASKSKTKYYTREEVSKHNTRNDCWLIVCNKVYDVTPFISYHPGGEYAILRHAGKDATESFEFHSKRAQKLWKEFCIGRVATEPLSSYTPKGIYNYLMQFI